MFHLSVILLFFLSLAGCMPKNNQGVSPPASAGGATGGTEGFTPPPSTSESGDESSTTELSGPVHIFKYTGRRHGHIGSTSLGLMREQLANAGLSWEQEFTGFKDGKTYLKRDGKETGQLNVFTIDASQLELSKKAKFCQCKLKEAEKICEPITSSTASSCR